MATMCVAAQVWAEPTLPANLQKRLPEPYSIDVIHATAPLQQGLIALLRGAKKYEPWIENGFKTSNLVVFPVRSFELGSSMVTVGGFCKPHDCGDNNWMFVYHNKTGALLLTDHEEVLANKLGREHMTSLQDILEMNKRLDMMGF